MLNPVTTTKSSTTISLESLLLSDLLSRGVISQKVHDLALKKIYDVNKTEKDMPVSA